ncbi:hypothetical protein NPIL_539361 [Nephila pilipes]|uniref:Uncharacterized protein n=1 Tax=Nephila pilipes TaxID=299642 RepID=A0A8X6IGU9_NEPPI|nr:hypothetical protein NPIL_539361 [Nephila pilipes]
MKCQKTYDSRVWIHVIGLTPEMPCIGFEKSPWALFVGSIVKKVELCEGFQQVGLRSGYFNPVDFSCADNCESYTQISIAR